METRGIPSRIKELTTELEYNFKDNRRYYFILGITDFPNPKESEEFILAIKENLSHNGLPCESIDLFKDVVAKGELSLGDTGNTFNELIDWIEKRAGSDKRCLIIYEIDPLLATWNDGDIRAFFLKALHHDGIRMPVLLISHLAGKFNLPRKETGQGKVLDFTVNA